MLLCCHSSETKEQNSNKSEDKNFSINFNTRSEKAIYKKSRKLLPLSQQHTCTMRHEICVDGRNYTLAGLTSGQISDKN